MAATAHVKAHGQRNLVYGWELVLYELTKVGSGPDGGCTVNPNDVVHVL